VKCLGKFFFHQEKVSTFGYALQFYGFYSAFHFCYCRASLIPAYLTCCKTTQKKASNFIGGIILGVTQITESRAASWMYPESGFRIGHILRETPPWYYGSQWVWGGSAVSLLIWHSERVMKTLVRNDILTLSIASTNSISLIISILSKMSKMTIRIYMLFMMCVIVNYDQYAAQGYTIIWHNIHFLPWCHRTPSSSQRAW